jgi:hypothetical protein
MGRKSDDVTAKEARISGTGQQHQARVAARRIRAMSKGVTLGGLKIKDLIKKAGGDGEQTTSHSS